MSGEKFFINSIQFFIAYSLFVAADITVRFNLIDRLLLLLSNSSFFLALGLICFSPLLMQEGRIYLGYNEPSHIAIGLLPGLFYFILKLRFFKALTIFFAILLAQSLTAVIVISIVSAILALKSPSKVIRRYSFLVVLFMLLFLVSAFGFSETYAYRIAGLFNLSDQIRLQDMNRTLFSFFSNFAIGFLVLDNSMLFGLGMFNYSEYHNIPNILMAREDLLEGSERVANEGSGHSVFIRLFAEFGILSPFIFYMLYKYVKNLGAHNTLLFSIFLTIFISRILKLGGYFDFGFFFMVSLITVYSLRPLGKFVK